MFGIIGAGYAWVIANLLPFLAWLPIVHRRYFKGLHVDWLIKDIAVVALLPTISAALLLQYVQWPPGKLELATVLVMIYAGLTALAASSSSTVRGWLRARARPGFA